MLPVTTRRRNDVLGKLIGGVGAEEQHLAGKPQPDPYLASAKPLDVQPDEALWGSVVSWVARTHSQVAIVVCVDREGQADEPHEHGAGRAVTGRAHLSEQVNPA